MIQKLGHREGSAAMEVFRDLYVHGSPEQVAALIAEVERSLSGGWLRDSVAEARLRTLSTGGSTTYCFSCTKQENRPAATIFIVRKEPVLFYVPNVVPNEQHQLSCQEYN